jgi:CDP-diacylglycerol--glycerol-3-phosphate 3-phosphatidyltransferase
MVDLVASVLLFGILGVVGLAYLVKVRIDGHARFSRVERAGSSVFLAKGPLQAAYWALSPFGRALARLSVSANAITFASLVLGAAAGAAFALGHFGVGAFLAALSTLGDALDGIVARESGTASDAGEVFDAAVDRYGEFLFLAGLAVWYRANVAVLSMVLFSILGSFMVSYSTAKAEALSVPAPRGSMRRAERAVYLNLGAALVPIVGRWNPGYQNAPIVAAILLVAVVANASAALRLDRIASLVTERDAAARVSSLRLKSARSSGHGSEPHVEASR